MAWFDPKRTNLTLETLTLSLIIIRSNTSFFHSNRKNHVIRKNVCLSLRGRLCSDNERQNSTFQRLICSISDFNRFPWSTAVDLTTSTASISHFPNQIFTSEWDQRSWVRSKAQKILENRLKNWPREFRLWQLSIFLISPNFSSFFAKKYHDFQDLFEIYIIPKGLIRKDHSRFIEILKFQRNFYELLTKFWRALE